MRITIEQERLAAALQTVAKAVATRATLPILSGIRLVAQGGQLRLAATDLELGIETAVEAAVQEEGSVVLPARHFGEIVRRMPRGSFSMEVDPERHAATLRWGRSEFVVHGFSAEQFPILPSPEGTALTLPAGALRQMVRQVSFAAAADDSRPVLTGAYVKADAGRIEVVTTDGVRLAYRQGVPDAAEGGFEVVVPVRALLEASRSLPEDDAEPVRVHVASNQIFFSAGDTRVVSRLLEGPFPNSRQVIPTEYPTRVTVSARDWLDACERAALIAREAGNAVSFSISGEAIVLKASAPEVGQAYEEVPAHIEGEPIQIAFNVRYIIEGLRAIADDDVAFELTGPLSPARMRLASGDDFFYIVLPLRTL